MLLDRYYIYKAVSNCFSHQFLTSILPCLIKIKHITVHILHVTSCVLVFLFLPPPQTQARCPQMAAKKFGTHIMSSIVYSLKKTPTTRNCTQLCSFTWQVLLRLHRKLEWEFCDFLLLPKYCNVAILCWLLLSGWPITLLLSLYSVAILMGWVKRRGYCLFLLSSVVLWFVTLLSEIIHMFP